MRVGRVPGVPRSGGLGHRIRRRKSLLSLPKPPTALFCITDYVAYGTLDAAKRLGLDVRCDVAVMGYNDLEASGWSIFDLSTVRQPLDDMARTAARLLLAHIDGSRRASAPELRRRTRPAGQHDSSCYRSLTAAIFRLPKPHKIGNSR
jgi:hypothetical protein